MIFGLPIPYALSKYSSNEDNTGFHCCMHAWKGFWGKVVGVKSGVRVINLNLIFFVDNMQCVPKISTAIPFKQLLCKKSLFLNYMYVARKKHV